MASKYEVLEYIRVYGPYVPMKKLISIFGKQVGNILNKLKERKKVKKYVKKKTESDNVLISDQVEYEEINTTPPGVRIYLSLADEAYDWLERKGVESFYDLPSAQKANANLMRSRNRTFEDIEDL